MFCNIDAGFQDSKANHSKPSSGGNWAWFSVSVLLRKEKVPVAIEVQFCATLACEMGIENLAFIKTNIVKI